MEEEEKESCSDSDDNYVEPPILTRLLLAVVRHERKQAKAALVETLRLYRDEPQLFNATRDARHLMRLGKTSLYMVGQMSWRWLWFATRLTLAIPTSRM